MKFLVVIVLALFPSVALARTTQLPASLFCGVEREEKTPQCQVRHYFGAWLPRWEVRLGSRLVATHEGMEFDPILDEEWRTIRVLINRRVATEFGARVDPKSGRLQFSQERGTP